MAEIRRRGLRERYESAVNTARATPRLESGGPIQGFINDIIGSAPTISDLEALVKMMAEMPLPPVKPFPSGVSAGQALSALPEQIENHPFQALAALAFPPTRATAAEMAPSHLRALTHHVIGGGKPITSLPARYEPLLADLVEQALEGGGQRRFIPNQGTFESSFNVGPRRFLGERFPERGFVFDYEDYQPVAERAGLDYIPPDIGPVATGNPVNELSRTLGRGYFDVDPAARTARVVDEYGFYPTYFSRFSGPRLFDPTVPQPPKPAVAAALADVIQGAMPKPLGRGYRNQAVEAGSYLGYLLGRRFPIEVTVPISEKAARLASELSR